MPSSPQSSLVRPVFSNSWPQRLGGKSAVRKTSLVEEDQAREQLNKLHIRKSMCSFLPTSAEVAC